MLTEIAHAKINLALHVRARRPDGYHEIESLFAFAEDGDRLTAEARSDGRLSLGIDGPFAEGLSNGPDNLVLRAAEALKRRHDVSSGVDIRLTKNLPVASGIGGGSADAAAALRLLSRLWRLDEDSEALLPIAADLGSDVPACVVSRTLMGTGRGEALDLWTIDGLSGMLLLLANPRRALSTTLVFAAWDGQDRGPLVADMLDDVMTAGRNDLQSPAMALVPEIADVLGEMQRLEGVRLARMSGSGATCFALFSDDIALDLAAATLARARPDWWIMTSRIR